MKENKKKEAMGNLIGVGTVLGGFWLFWAVSSVLTRLPDLLGL